MAMKKICGNCQYQRENGWADAGVPGEGTWCSNSQSPLFRARVGPTDGCEKFTPRGKKAGIGMRLKIKGVRIANRWLKKK